MVICDVRPPIKDRAQPPARNGMKLVLDLLKKWTIATIITLCWEELWWTYLSSSSLRFFLELNAFSSCVNLTHFANEFCLDVFCSFRWRYNIQLQFHMFDGSLSMMNTWFWFFVKPVVVHSLHYKEVSSRLAVGDLEDIGWNIIELTFWKHFCIYI